MPAHMATGPFPITLEGETIHFRFRCQKYDGGVAKVDRSEDGSSSTFTVILQVPEASVRFWRAGLH
jgi:prenyltransferase beta subunit